MTIQKPRRIHTRAPRIKPGMATLLHYLLVAGIPFIVYLRTLAPTVYGLDSAELTTGAYTLGIVHAPGAPFYLLIGHLFTYLPFGDVGYRLNLLSACAAALTILFIFRLLVRLTRHTALSLATALCLAFSYYFWISALEAELYALAALFAAIQLNLALSYREEKKPSQLYLLGLSFGLGLGVHLSLALLGPGITCLALSSSENCDAKNTRSEFLPLARSEISKLLIALACAITGMLVFLYLPVRHLAEPALNYPRDYWGIDLATWDGFWWMVTGRMFSEYFMAVPLDRLPAELGSYLNQLWSNFLGIGLWLGLAGIFLDLKRRPVLNLSLTLLLFCYLAFYLPYGVADKELMFLPTFLIWVIWIGIGLQRLGEKLREWKPGWSISFLPTALFLLAIAGVWFNFNYVDLSNDRSARELGQAILSGIERDAWFFGTWIEVPLIEYLQLVEGQRSDVTPRNLVFLSPESARELAVQAVHSGSPVYTTAPTVFSTEKFLLKRENTCPCYRISLKSGADSTDN